jgi:hypothetical protein
MPVAALNLDERSITQTVMACANDAGYPREDREVTAQPTSRLLAAYRRWLRV